MNQLRSKNYESIMLMTRVAGSLVWNALPSSLRQEISYRQFKRLLKTFIFDSQSATVTAYLSVLGMWRSSNPNRTVVGFRQFFFANLKSDGFSDSFGPPGFGFSA